MTEIAADQNDRLLFPFLGLVWHFEIAFQSRLRGALNREVLAARFDIYASSDADEMV
jgi:hypothetical protein